ncbi:hypothetical protein K7711_29500 [Nocardia sp. CA2R105]|uniref:hypothetical protein n=1 Tax=Nocardia coffeae TaxID=2873381 RepID=UPI001CA6E916|nr:hypothetical protein [Nocardia coffeae]MBY8860640.1 hypothetical protein [Nocardia coffeae]
MPEGATLLSSDEQVRRACDMTTLVDTVQVALREAAGPEVDLPHIDVLPVGAASEAVVGSDVVVAATNTGSSGLRCVGSGSKRGSM